jgi:hypothetical protein
MENTDKNQAPQLREDAVSGSVTASELRIGNLVKAPSGINVIIKEGLDLDFLKGYKLIKLTEEWVCEFGFSTTNDSSAGKRYSYVINGVFNSDLSFTFWKTTKEKGRFFRGDLELKSVHQLQNLYFALTGSELQIVL